MKNLLLITLILFCPLLTTAQERVALLSDLRNRVGQGNAYVLVAAGSANGDAMGGLFLWNAGLTTADNNRSIIRPAGLATGGWEKSEPLSQKRGTSTFTYTLGQLTYTFNHGLSAAPVNLQYSIQSTVIPGPSCWTATATTVSVTFNALPLFTGTVPFTICWIAYPY